MLTVYVFLHRTQSKKNTDLLTYNIPHTIISYTPILNSQNVHRYNGVTTETVFKLYLCPMIKLPHGPTSAAADKYMQVTSNILNIEQI